MYPPSLALGCSRLAGKTAIGKKATKKYQHGKNSIRRPRP